MENKSLLTLMTDAWKEWRQGTRESRRIKEYAETIHNHATMEPLAAGKSIETSVMQDYFRACRAKEAEVSKNIRAMAFGATPEEKEKLKTNLMSLGIDLDSIMSEADTADNIKDEVMSTKTEEKEYIETAAAVLDGPQSQ